jgi:hypothetical protein
MCALGLWHPCMPCPCILPPLPPALLHYTPTTLNTLISTQESSMLSHNITNRTTHTNRITRITHTIPTTHKVTSWTAPQWQSATLRHLQFTLCLPIIPCMLHIRLSQIHSISQPLLLALRLQQNWLNINQHIPRLLHHLYPSKDPSCLPSMALLLASLSHQHLTIQKSHNVRTAQIPTALELLVHSRHWVRFSMGIVSIRRTRVPADLEAEVQTLHKGFLEILPLSVWQKTALQRIAQH